MLPSTEVVGYENVESEDMRLPELKCLQGMSPEVMERQYPDAEPGKFFLSSTKETHESPLRVIVVHHHRSRYKPIDESVKDDKLCISKDAIRGSVYGFCSDCEFAEWGQDRTPPRCSLSHNFVSMTTSGPALTRFNRTSFKAGQDFASSCRLSVPRKPLWGYETLIQSIATTAKVKGRDITYYRLGIAWDRSRPVSEPLQKMAKDLYSVVHDFFEAGRINANEEIVIEEKPAKKSAQEEFDDKIPF